MGGELDVLGGAVSNKKSSAEFIGLEGDAESGTFRLKLRPELCGGRGHVWGGVGLVAAMEALKRQSGGRPAILASAQFLGNHENARELVLQSELTAHGRSISHGKVTAHLDGKPFMNAFVSLGEREAPERGVWVTMPDVPHPDDCQSIDVDSGGTSIHGHVDLRLARGKLFDYIAGTTENKDGRITAWAHMPDLECDAGTITLLADYMAGGVDHVLGIDAYGVSLDNTIRFARIVPTKWVLCDMHIEHISDGFGYGSTHLWSEDGTLLATANQSVVVRIPQR